MSFFGTSLPVALGHELTDLLPVGVLREPHPNATSASAWDEKRVAHGQQHRPVRLGRHATRAAARPSRSGLPVPRASRTTSGGCRTNAPSISTLLSEASTRTVTSGSTRHSELTRSRMSSDLYRRACGHVVGGAAHAEHSVPRVPAGAPTAGFGPAHPAPEAGHRSPYKPSSDAYSHIPAVASSRSPSNRGGCTGGREQWRTRYRRCRSRHPRTGRSSERTKRPWIVRWSVAGKSTAIHSDKGRRRSGTGRFVDPCQDCGRALRRIGGEPLWRRPSRKDVQIHVWVRRWLAEEWPERAPRTRTSAVEALARFVPLLVASDATAAPPGLRSSSVRELTPTRA